MNSRWKILIPILVLLFPVVFWLVLIKGKNKFKRLPILAAYEITEAGDTVYHTIPDFALQNQLGDTISLKDVDNKIFVANFFFATCKTICPVMNAQVKRVQDAFKDNDNIRILSYTVDPESDSVQALAAYGERMQADPKKWWFLTGPKQEIYDLARDGYLVPAAVGVKEENFFHTQTLMLFDKERRMRAIREGTEATQVDTLIDEIKVLLKEYE